MCIWFWIWIMYPNLNLKWVHVSGFEFEMCIRDLKLKRVLYNFAKCLSNIPVFLWTYSRALAKLVSEDGWVDQCMGIGRIGMFDIIARTATKWRLNVEGTLPTDLNMRGVDDPEVLPKYYFRDDALLLFEIIEKYVSEVVNGNYGKFLFFISDFDDFPTIFQIV